MNGYESGGVQQELVDAFRALGICRRFYAVACQLGLEADAEIIREDINRIRKKIAEIAGEGGEHIGISSNNSGR